MWIEHVKDIAEAIALVCAGGFFLYKWHAGYLRNNLSLAVQCQRQKGSESDGAPDYLAVIVKLKKGPNGSVTLHDAAAVVRCGDTTETLRFDGIDRSGYKLDQLTTYARRTIDWATIDQSSPFLKLIPGEETELCAFCRVPAGSACSIEVGIIGQKTQGHPFGQWKASCTSLPISGSNCSSSGRAEDARRST